MSKIKKKQFTRNEFSDQEVYNEIKDDIRDIRDRNLKHIEEEMQILKLYHERKKQKRRNKILNKEGLKQTQDKVRVKKGIEGLGEDDEEEGEINEGGEMVDEKNEIEYEGIPTIRQIGDHIRPITLTRNKICGMLKSRKFFEIVRGCFVRYKAEGSGPNSNAYLLAQIVGLDQSQKEYFPNKSVRTRVLLKLQQSSEVIITLTIDHLSNQHPPGVLQIQKWLQTNRNKIPKEKQLKDKKQELQNYMFGKINSEEIDRNIYEQAKQVAKGNEQIKTDISKLIYFMNGHLHDLNVTLQEMEFQKDKQEEIDKKMREREECETIIQILRKKRADFFEDQRKKTKEEKERSARKKYSELFFEDRKNDKINQKNQRWLAQLYNHEGVTAVVKEIQDAHKTFEFDIEL